jgi:chromosome segregation ATPase
MITSTGQQQHSLSLDVVKSDHKEGVMSQREVQLQAEIDEVWRRYSELNDLKNTLYARNEDLRVEVDSFKTHFSKYDALEFKKKLGASETFQNSLYNELTLLREERDMHSWQVAKLMQRVTQA